MKYAKNIVVMVLAFMLMALPLTTSKAASKKTPAPDTIKLGCAIALSGTEFCPDS